ncbi:MAG: N-acyl homoserine lactonase family protein [Verrucomicrobia bacterium]|nr:N-acyl homoserine lactonase family protein [Verrucomicrobiota bacterium]
MSIKIHNILTGELESSYATSVFGAPTRHPLIKREDLLPYGFKERIQKDDGTFEPGLMVPVPVWYLEGAKSKILIDTGLGDCSEIMELQSRYGIDYIARKTTEQEILTALHRKALGPEDIDIIVLSHLHFDHIGNTELFPNAHFFVHASEIPMLISPPRFATFYYREWAHKLTRISDRLTPITENFKLTADIQIVRLGGHSPGQLVVLVQTKMGRVCLASDFLYNYINLGQEWPIGPVWNMEEWIAGLRFIRGEADIIIPNHDFEFYQHFPDGIIG